MEPFPKPGDFCPNQTCLDYQKLQTNQSKPNIIKAGKTRKGVQRFQCQTCGKYFVETIGTIFYRKRTSEHSGHRNNTRLFTYCLREFSL